MLISVRLYLAPIILAFVTGNAFGQQNDHDAVLALMDQAFDAVASGNSDDWRAIQLAEGTQISFRQHASGEPGKLEMRMRTNEAEALATSDDGHENVERWTGDPTVMIRGPIAVVWGEYEYWIDGTFSHCGVDAADLVKVDGVWKLANWMWTVEKEGCPTDPSDPEASNYSSTYELGQMNRDFAAALNAKDGALAASYYTEDAVLIPPGEPMVRGRAAIEAYWQVAIDSGGVRDASVMTIEAKSTGNLGYEIGSFVLTVDGPNGEAVQDHGRYIELLERGVDGKWYSTVGFWNASPE